MNHKGKRRATAGLAVNALVAMLLIFNAGAAQAATITFDGSPGTAAPPATLGGITMMPFSNDARATFVDVTTVPGPLGTITFNHALSHRKIGFGWATWSHGYTGDVYYDSTAAVTITMPAGTSAFYLYVEPDPFGVTDVTAVADNGTTSGAVGVEGNSGAKYFGFYATGTTLLSVSVSSSVGFAIGEFALGEPTCTITGTAANDNLVGTPGNDVICGLAGNDAIQGLGLDDIVFGGPGNDAIYGGTGDDTLFGEDGKDSLYGGNRPFVSGSPGVDKLYGGPLDDALMTKDGGGGDTADGGPGTDGCTTDTTDTRVSC